MSLDRDVWPFAAVPAFLAIVAAAWTPLASIPLLVVLGFVLWFFRDPEREPPDRPGILVSPADGRVLVADARRVSIFMNVFDVHVCRAPMAGRVASVEHLPGRFAAAFRDVASERNERAAILIEDGAARLRFTLVAGLVARRIVCRVRPGDALTIGERVGLIRFGSRVDVDLPPGASPAVRVGDRVVAGISVIADLPGPVAAGTAGPRDAEAGIPV